MQYQSCLQGERDYIEAVSTDEAIFKYEELPEKEVSFEEAFPGVELEEAWEK